MISQAPRLLVQFLFFSFLTMVQLIYVCKIMSVWIIRYASICAMESTCKLDDEQWLAYWIIYSFITLFEMAAENVLYW